MWDIINKLKADGKTILLTTQYLEEADQLADNIVVIDGGKAIAEGTAKELKAKIGKDRLELTFAKKAELEKAVAVLGKSIADSSNKELTATTVINDTNKDVAAVLAALTKAKISVSSMAIHKPTLDDVFLSLTGKTKKPATAAKKGKK